MQMHLSMTSEMLLGSGRSAVSNDMSVRLGLSDLVKLPRSSLHYSKLLSRSDHIGLWSAGGLTTVCGSACILTQQQQSTPWTHMQSTPAISASTDLQRTQALIQSCPHSSGRWKPFWLLGCLQLQSPSQHCSAGAQHSNASRMHQQRMV